MARGDATPGAGGLFVRAEVSLGRTLLRLSPRTKVLLAGGRPIVIDGQTLDPEFQLLLKLRALRGGRALSSGTPRMAREHMRRETIRFQGELAEVRAVRDLTIAGAAGPLAARHYVPDEPGGPHPLLVYFHGGGFVSGDLDTHEAPVRHLCREAGVHVLAIHYRRAPEHPFPAAVEDAAAALRWAQEHASELGCDPARVGVGGDSAGGNLAGAVARISRDAGAPAAFSLLIYPAVEPHVNLRPSMHAFAEGFLLSRADVAWYDVHYLANPASRLNDPRVDLLSGDLSGLCPSIVVVAGFDPLRDEGDAYAAALEAAGNQVTLVRLDGFIHGFINMIGVSRVAEDALTRIARSLRETARARAARTA